MPVNCPYCPRTARTGPKLQKHIDAMRARGSKSHLPPIIVELLGKNGVPIPVLAHAVRGV